MNDLTPHTWTCYTRQQPFDAKNYFCYYHWFELYDENKLYTKESFTYDYGYGLLTYYYNYYTIYIDDDEATYVIAKEDLKEIDLEKLQPYCQCTICTASWYHYVKYFGCRCCYGCLYSEFPAQCYINDARKMLNY